MKSSRYWHRTSKDGRLDHPVWHDNQPDVEKEIGKAHWRRDGREVYYQAPGNRIMVVAVDGRDRPSSSSPSGPLFELSGTIRGWDVSADGQRFLANLAPNETNAANAMTVVLNWPVLLDPLGPQKVHKPVKFGTRRIPLLSLLSEARLRRHSEQSPQRVQRWLWLLLLPSRLWDPRLNRAVSQFCSS